MRILFCYLFFGFIGFIIGISLANLSASVTQVNQSEVDPKDLQLNLRKLFQSAQNASFRVDITTPNLSNIKEHEVMFCSPVSTPTMTLYVRNNNILWQVALTSK